MNVTKSALILWIAVENVTVSDCFKGCKRGIWKGRNKFSAEN